jgi:transposase-like protein
MRGKREINILWHQFLLLYCRDVLRAVRDLLPNIRLKEVVMDFEAAAWKAMGEVFPDVTVRGCAFHWAQALDRKVINYNI